MKTSKSPEGNEVTPSKKKLKQARLPFKIISEVSPKPVTPPSRKRKLSATVAETASKVGKLSKENEECDDPVVISDDECKVETKTEKSQKVPNPYVKLVDAAWKKRNQKGKGSKKKRGSRKSESKEADVEKNDCSATADNDNDECEKMEVDDPECETNEGADNPNETESINVNKSLAKETIVLEDSNNSSDVKTTETSQNEAQSDSSDTEKDSKVDQTVLDKEDSTEMEDESKSEVKDEQETETKDCEEEELPVTPKRSLRNRTKVEENNNSKGSPSNKLNESVTSNPSTPKQNRSSSVTKLDESLNESLSSNTNLTPKQLQKKLESAKKKEEREKEKVEREKKRQQEKEERAKQRQEKEDQKKREREEKEEAKRKEREEKEEQKKKEREEKEEQRRKEKEEKEKQKELEKKLREEKEEQKKKEKEEKEEEKRKKQEALEQEKQEQELKKKKAAEAFVNFFVPKQKAEKDQPTVGAVNNSMLSSFTIKSDMRLAPTTRVNLSEERIQTLEKLIKEQNENELYLKGLKNGVKPMCNGKTWPLSDRDDDDVILVEDELPPLDGTGESISNELSTREKLRPKLFSFHENRRPPYWGTWRKKSSFVKPRRPFCQDEKQLDYEVDSDDDWEEEQEGESIDGSVAGSDDEQGPDEYEVDNEVFVPHGYLSDEEATMDEDDVLSLSPETQKTRLKNLEDEFESEMKKPTEKLKPRLYGLLWENSDGGKPENCVDTIWNYFGKLSMIMNDPTPFLQPPKTPEEAEKKKVKKKKEKKVVTEVENGTKNEKKKKVKVDEKEGKPKPETKKPAQDVKKNQPGINLFLTKMKS